MWSDFANLSSPAAAADAGIESKAKKRYTYTQSLGMKIVVTHASPDLDAIMSVWLIRKFIPGWENAVVEFVPAGERSSRVKSLPVDQIIQTTGRDEVIHVDTGLGPLDHHQTSDQNVCAASRTWEYVLATVEGGEKWDEKAASLARMVKIVVDIDHFKEVFWADPTADYHDFSLFGILEGLKFKRPDQDEYYTTFISDCLDLLLAQFENKLWAEKEIENNGKQFTTKWGKGIAFETINDSVLKLAQKMGYVIVVRKDPRKGYVRIKARPAGEVSKVSEVPKVSKGKKKDVDLTLVYEQLKKTDPEATWFLHVSKKMLLNGTVKNPKMIPTKLTLDEIIKIIESI